MAATNGAHDEVFVVSRRREGRGSVLELVGELDLEAVPRLESEAREAINGPSDMIEIDARRLTFVDSAGLKAILAVQTDADRHGVEFQFGPVSDPVARTIEKAGLSSLLRHDP